MSAPASRLVVDGVGKDYGYRHVLRDVAFTVEEGEFVALVGANGAGKTTLLRLIAGLARPTQGSVRIADVDLRRAGPGLRRRIGFVSHESLLYAELTGMENLRFHARLLGIADADAVIAGLRDALDLAAILDRPVRVLSRGNRQRLALARALLHAPRVLLLDEPFTGLDEATSTRLLDTLHALVATGRTVILTTHDRAVVEAGPRRLIRLDAGVVVEDRALQPGTAAATLPAPVVQPSFRTPPALVAAAAAVAGKDLRLELRSRDALGSAGLFALCVLVTASFTSPANETANGMATGVLWISLLFATLLAVGRSMGREQAERGIEGLLLAPIPRAAIYLGKTVASLVVLAILAVAVSVLFLALMAGSATVDWAGFAGTIALGTLGLVIVGSLFSGIALGSRLGESLLPMLVMPVVIPLMVGSVELTRSALGGGAGGVLQWLAILGAFDVMMLVAALATFVHVVEE